VNAAQVKKLFRTLAAAFEGGRDRLGRLDAAIGDGDHGAGMSRAFAKALESVEAAETEDAGELLEEAGRAVMSSGGGASGALFATLFLELGRACSGCDEMRAEHLALGSRNALKSIVRIGKAQPGDKTMLDALAPASQALEQWAELGLTEALRRASQAAAKGAAATEGMTAKHGRARYVPEAGVGHRDPGAESVYLIFDTMWLAAKECCAE
jgi:dihydroxyacetone kinase-like protein